MKSLKKNCYLLVKILLACTTHLSWRHGLPGHEELRVHIVQVPFEGLAAEPLPEGLPLADIPVVALQNKDYYYYYNVKQGGS